jgi:Flp pilus assembly CpaE family ATPase
MIDRHETTAPAQAARVLPRRAMRLTVIDDPPPTGDRRPADRGRQHDATTAHRRGPLLAVCGLCGGAGTSTLAYLIALAVARSSPRSVLVADISSPGGSIASIAGVQSPRSLTELADHVAAGLLPGRLVASTSDRLRVLATGPRLPAICDSEALGLLLDQARERYALTVIDCGTLAHQASQVALTRASHVAWVLPATASAISRAQPVLAAMDSSCSGRELVLARPDSHRPKATMSKLKRVAHDRQATLILVPELPDPVTAGAAQAIEIAQIPLQAILGALSRP